MGIRWTPGGLLDIATDPADLPEASDGRDVVSNALTRCRNLRLDRGGMARTRLGSAKIGTAPVGTPVYRLIEHAGDRYAFAGTRIYRNETEIATGLKKAAWDAVLYNPYNIETQSVFAANGTDRKRIEGSSVYEWGLDAPTKSCDKTVGEAYTYEWEYDNDHAADASCKITSTSSDETVECVHAWEDQQLRKITPLDDGYAVKTTYWFEGWDEYETVGSDTYVATAYGCHAIRYTYCRYSGDTLVVESNPSEPHLIRSGFSGVISWPAPSDPQVTHVRIYVTIERGTTHYYHSRAEVAHRCARIYLSQEQLGGELEYDHDRPPKGAILAGPSYDGHLFMAKENKVYFCKNRRPEYWPGTYYVEASPPQTPVVAMVLYNAQLYVLTRHQIIMMQGSGANTFFPLPMAAATGTINKNTAVALQGKGIYHLAYDGLYLFAGGEDAKISDSRLQPIWDGVEAHGVQPLNKSAIENAWLRIWRKRLYFAYPGNSATYPRNMLVWDLETDHIVYYTYPFDLVAPAIDVANDRFLVADSAGHVREIERAGRCDDDGAAIEWEVRSKEFNYLRAFFPRHARWDVEPGVGATVSGHVYLDGVELQAHPITQRSFRKRLVAQGNGERLQLGVDGSGQVTIYAAEVE